MHLTRLRRFATLLGLSLICLAAAADEAMIPYQTFTLDNGLTLVVHKDAKAPVVAVNIWYHVGSRNEAEGKTGYAHLFEHLMFQGSGNAPGEYLELVDKVGATDLNGTTWFDRTNYFQTVPTGALDRILFLESDRMGHMLEAIDQAMLDEQRGVVQNEKRQGDNQPYSMVFERILKNLFPPGHPYSWSTIGSMEDLEAASLEDMQEWFRAYYGPNNAVLVVAGDVEAQQVLERVEHWFGEIPPGPPIASVEEWIPRHTVERREILQDRVPQERVYLAWTAPRWGTEAAARVELAADILAGGKNSRLYERLVYRDQIATDVSVSSYAFEIAGMFTIQASVKEGASGEAVEAALREELQALLDEGPTRRELERVKTEQRAAFLRGIEKVGGFVGKSGVLARSAVYGGDPGYYQTQLAHTESATARQVKDAAATWLGQAAYVARVVPYDVSLQAGADAPDRSAMPAVAEPAPAEFPAVARRTLDNGLELRVIERRSVPVVEMSLVVDAGYATDDPGRSGEASLAMAMLDEGTESLSALEISERVAELGARLSAGGGLDTASVTLSALTENLDDSLELFADVILNPSFPAEELDRQRAQYLNAIRQEKTRPVGIALRLLPELLYGEGHAYARPLSGTGTEASIANIDRDHLADWHRTWFRPGNATLIVAGDTSMEEIAPRIEALFKDWAPGAVPERDIAQAALPAGEVIYLVDRPQAQQSIIFGSQLIVPMSGPHEEAIRAMNDVLGGQFSARINMNLREDKGWSYGARSLISDTRAQRPFIAYASVQSDRTADSLAEMRREIRDIRKARPPEEQELQRVQRSRTLSLPGRWETNRALLSAQSQIVSFGLPEDYWDAYAERINRLTLEQVREAAVDTLEPDRLTWVVIGDRAQVEPALRELGVAEIRFLDADGKPVDEVASRDR